MAVAVVAAIEELNTMTDGVERHLIGFLQERLSDEQRTRITALLEGRVSLVIEEPTVIQRFRAIDVLERIGSDRSKEALKAAIATAKAAEDWKAAREALHRISAPVAR